MTTVDVRSAWHPGEVYVRSHAFHDMMKGHPESSVALRLEGMEEEGRAFIRPFMPDQHRAFFMQNLQSLFVGSRDPAGRIWASVLPGPPGFVESPDRTSMTINASPIFGDPINLAVGSRIGLLGLEFHTRRRNRLNGTIVEQDAFGKLTLKVDQSFGNCPKYIAARRLVYPEAALAQVGSEREVERGAGALGQGQQAIVAGASTLFIASYWDGNAEHTRPESSGCDVSHRGGVPGFVQQPDAHTLVIPDYYGNMMFNTFGNIHVNGKAGLLFIDFNTGDTLQMTGDAKIIFDDQSLPGADRSVHFKVHSWIHVKGAFPGRTAGKVEISPYSPGGGVPIRCTKVTQEAQGIKTYEFEAPRPANRPLIWLPGQYASFDIEGLTQDERVLNRTWTISSHPQRAYPGTFTISVKKAGLVSAHLFNNMRPGMTLTFKGVGGTFTPPPVNDGRAVLLLAAGIGITPMRAMFHEFASRGVNTVLLYSVRDASELAFLPELQEVAAIVPAVQVIATITGHVVPPNWSGCIGRLTAASLLQQVPDVDARVVYMCGPVGFMQGIEAALTTIRGGARADVYQESFNY